MKILTIAHTKGGVSKTTTTWHIICELQRQKKDFIVIDLDHQRTIYNLNKALRKDKFVVHAPASINALDHIMNNPQSDLVIIDTGGNGDQINKRALYYATDILTPIGNDSPTEIIGFKKFEAILHEVGKPHINILFSNVHPRATNFQDIEQVLASYDNKTILDSKVRSKNLYKITMGKGIGVTELKKTKSKQKNNQQQKVIQEIKQLVKELEL
jgi:chromosome partitioning protein